MKTIRKIGYGIFSLITLLFCTVSNGFPRSRIFSLLKEKVSRIQKNYSDSDETLILEQKDSSFSEEFASHTSHSSHRSHASHQSGTTGRAVSRSTTQTKSTPVPLVSAIPPAAIANTYASFLMPRDLEVITGLKGIQQTQEQSIVHFYLSNGTEILRVRFLKKEYFNKYSNDSNYSPVTGIPDAALLGTIQLPMQLLVQRGNECFEITTFFKEGLELYLSLDQLKTVARFISSRYTRP